jgi:hypothetical protein
MLELAADAILLIHFLFVLFIVGGLALTWIGAWHGWLWVRSIAFRLAHLAAMVFVASESLMGMACPLTLWEDALRGMNGGAASEKSFIARWVHQLLFYSAPEWVFTVLYVAFALIVAVTFWFVPLQRAARNAARNAAHKN